MPLKSGYRACIRQWVEGRNFWKGFSLYTAFVLSLAFFLHFREVPMEVLEIGKRAPRYVIAQIDFSFSDTEATQTLKQEAAKDISRVNKISPEEIHQFRLELEKRFVQHEDWRRTLHCTFQHIYRLLEEVEKELIVYRFTDKRTYQKIEELEIPQEEFYPLFVISGGAGETLLPSEFWDHLEKHLEKSGLFEQDAIRYVLHFFAEERWLLEEDVSTERYVRGLAQDKVPNKYTYVDAGSEIVTQGEIVTARHIAMVQGMQQALAQSLRSWTPETITGSLILSLTLSLAAFLCLHVLAPKILESFSQMTLLLTIILLTLCLGKAVEYALLHQGKNLIEIARFQLVVPFAALLISSLLSGELAVLASLFLTIVLGISLAVDHIFFLLGNFVAALMMVFFAQGLHRRKEILLVCIQVWIACMPVLIACNLVEGTFWSLNPLTDLMSSALFMALTAVLVAGFLPILESLFGVLTDMTLIEYMDPNHPLLRRLTLEAPGTYQHSLVVGNLAEMAARAIGANGLLCRVAALYHDIGKLFNPHYFTENQLSGFNIHQLLTPLESTQVIIAHVTEGEVLARKYKLPESFIDIIREHHGTTLVYYFYCKQLEQLGKDPLQAQENLFRYAGPKPRSKEAGIMMLADVLEAASRSLEEVSETSVTEMVERLVSEKIQDHQLDQCQLSFEELSIVKKTMIKTFLVTRHLRVKYARGP